MHLVTEARQPDLQILCDQSWTQPGWNQRHPHGPVFMTTDGRAYTFDPHCVTCAACHAFRLSRAGVQVVAGDRDATCAWDCQRDAGHSGPCSRHPLGTGPEEQL